MTIFSNLISQRKSLVIIYTSLERQLTCGSWVEKIYSNSSHKCRVDCEEKQYNNKRKKSCNFSPKRLFFPCDIDWRLFRKGRYLHSSLMHKWSRMHSIVSYQRIARIYNRKGKKQKLSIYVRNITQTYHPDWHFNENSFLWSFRHIFLLYSPKLTNFERYSSVNCWGEIKSFWVEWQTCVWWWLSTKSFSSKNDLL